MATTYTPGGDTALDRTRFEIGDTGLAGRGMVLQDEEISAEIARHGSEGPLVYLRCAERLKAALNQQTDLSGPVQSQRRVRVSEIDKIIEQLDRRVMGAIEPKLSATTPLTTDLPAADIAASWRA